MKKIIVIFLMFVCLFTFISDKQVQVADRPDDHLIILGSVVLEKGDDFYVYNAYYMQIEIHNVKTFIYENELFKPEIGALVMRKLNEEHWTVYQTYSLYEYYQK